MTHYGPTCPICANPPDSATGSEPEEWARGLCGLHYFEWQAARARLAGDTVTPAATEQPSPVFEDSPSVERGAAAIVRTIVVSERQELEAPTSIDIHTADEIAEIIKRDKGINAKMLDSDAEGYRVVSEEDFIFKFSHKVKLRPYIKGFNDCEDQSRQYTDLCNAWGCNNIIFEGDAPQGWHRWAGAVVKRSDGTLAVVMIEPQNGQRVTAGYTPATAEAYG